MDKKYRVWIIVLLVLLIAALAGVVLVKNQWDASRAELVSVNDQLAQAQEDSRTLAGQLQSAEEASALAAEEAESLRESVETLSTEVDTLSGELAEKDDLLAEKDDLIAEKDGLLAGQKNLIAEKDAQIADLAQAEPSEEPSAEPAEADETRTQLTTSLDRILVQISLLSDSDAEMTAEEKLAALDGVEAELTVYAGQLNDVLDASDAEKSALEARLADADTALANLHAQIEDSRKAIAELEKQLADASGAENADLAVQLADEQAKVAELTTQLEEALAEYGNALIELRLYRLTRDPEAGAYYADNALADLIEVSADGVTAKIALSNSILSANVLTVELQLDGETIAASQPLAPGEALDSLTLDAPLAAGEHKGVAVLSSTSAAGEVLSRQRIPVRIVVAE